MYHHNLGGENKHSFFSIPNNSDEREEYGGEGLTIIPKLPIGLESYSQCKLNI